MSCFSKGVRCSDSQSSESIDRGRKRPFTKYRGDFEVQYDWSILTKWVRSIVVESRSEIRQGGNDEKR
jgi:hypothetical protein